MSAHGASGRGINVKCFVRVNFCCYLLRCKVKTLKMNWLNTVNLRDKYGFTAEIKTLVEAAKKL